jgi:hypothetical protein
MSVISSYLFPFAFFLNWTIKNCASPFVLLSVSCRRTCSFILCGLIWEHIWRKCPIVSDSILFLIYKRRGLHCEVTTILSSKDIWILIRCTFNLCRQWPVCLHSVPRFCMRFMCAFRYLVHYRALECIIESHTLGVSYIATATTMSKHIWFILSNLLSLCLTHIFALYCIWWINLQIKFINLLYFRFKSPKLI